MKALWCAALIACGQPPQPDHAHHDMHHAGTVHLPITCGADAQSQLDHALFYLHNMDYVRARAGFETAIAAHPSCAMLYWGLGMTFFQPLWPGQPSADSLRAGATAIEHGRSATQANAVERDYVTALAAYYDQWETTDSPTRLKHWAAGQQRLAEHHPDDLEAQAFSALARLATLDKKDKTYAEARAVSAQLEELLRKHPDHPGLMHYLLHAYDNPLLAPSGVDIANKYVKTSPDAAHALHMPSHIHTRLGNWEQSVAANIKSAQAALAHPAPGNKVSRDFVHATDYMTYAYLQMGDDERATQVAGKLDPATAYELGNGPAAYGLASAPARLALERKRYKDAAALAVRAVPYSWDQFPWAEAVTHAARGLGAARTGDTKTAEAEMAELDRLQPLVEAPWWKERVEIDRDVVGGWVAHAKHDDKKAEELLRSAAKRELAAGKDSVEPGHVIPAAESLGELLLELKRPKEALEIYRAALADSPRRFNALAGAGEAAELAGEVAEARTFYTELVAISPHSTRPERARAQAFLAK